MWQPVSDRDTNVRWVQNSKILAIDIDIHDYTVGELSELYVYWTTHLGQTSHLAQ